MVFLLKSEVLGKTLSKSVSFEANQYELALLNVEVESPFTNTEYPFEVSVSLLDEDKKERKNFMQSFFLSVNKLKLLKGKESRLELKFLAMTSESRSCRISFFEQMRGEFIYEVKVKVLRPVPLRTIKLKDLHVHSPQEVMLDVPCSNEYLVRAKKLYSELNKSFKPKPVVYGAKYLCEAVPFD
jgi:hypothetical protein